ncbi:MAG: hypothetical protein EPO28_16840 [Saprospiraceae bacterium]|nr:MAG: hypothetical protein EPO28_16840 [Saprospiraceae bacterium]
MKTGIQKLSLLFGLVLLAAAWIWTERESPINSPHVSTEIKTGRGPNCTDRGLCSVSEAMEGQPGLPDADFAGDFYKNEESRVVLEIPKSAISVQEAEEQFANGEFVLPEDFSMPADIAETLDLTGEQAILRAGAYPVQSMETHFIIVF